MDYHSLLFHGNGRKIDISNEPGQKEFIEIWVSCPTHWPTFLFTFLPYIEDWHFRFAWWSILLSGAWLYTKREIPLVWTSHKRINTFPLLFCVFWHRTVFACHQIVEFLMLRDGVLWNNRNVPKAVDFSRTLEVAWVRSDHSSPYCYSLWLFPFSVLMKNM